MRRKDLLGLRGVPKEEILEILETASRFREVSKRRIKKVPTLRGRTVLNLFFEASTRTRSSFELAEKRLSADSLNFSGSGSALSKVTLRAMSRAWPAGIRTVTRAFVWPITLQSVLPWSGQSSIVILMADSFSRMESLLFTRRALNW